MAKLRVSVCWNTMGIMILLGNFKLDRSWLRWSKSIRLLFLSHGNADTPVHQFHFFFLKHIFFLAQSKNSCSDVQQRCGFPLSWTSSFTLSWMGREQRTHIYHQWYSDTAVKGFYLVTVNYSSHVSRAWRICPQYLLASLTYSRF